jgi:hypothetical protein
MAWEEGLLDVDVAAGGFELGFYVFGFVPGCAFFDNIRKTVDKGLGLFKA